MHAVLFLILTFFKAAGLFMLVGAEFLALLLIVVYVGAVAVLFLFVVMMLDVDFAALRQGFLQYAPVGVLVGVILLLELLLVAGTLTAGLAGDRGAPAAADPADTVDNIEAIGRVLYTRYVYLFQGAGRVLLVAMIGAIVLTLRHKPNVKRQDIHARSGASAATRRQDRQGQERGRGSLGATHDGTGIGLGHYLTVAAILFTLGVFGIFINRKNVIIILMSVELILLAVNINLVAFSRLLNDICRGRSSPC